jgi:hypothetical protein
VWVPQGVDAWVPGIVAEDEQAGGNGLVKAELVLEEEDDNNEDDFETTSGKVPTLAPSWPLFSVFDYLLFLFLIYH